jgi:hypothetical protein
MAPVIRALGIPWYRREDYPRILEIMADREVLPPTFNEWRKRASQVEGGAKAQGMIVVRAVIDPDKFSDWCRARGLDIDARARTSFANDLAASGVKHTH